MLIVGGIDRTTASRSAARRAVDLARRLQRDRLFVHVVEPVSGP